MAAARADADQRAAARADGKQVAPEVAFADGVEQASAQLALALRISPGAADHRVYEALALTGRHPAAVDALEAGAVTLAKVRIIAEQTEQLSDAQAAAVTERVLPKAPQQTPPLLRAAVRRAVARTDPDAVRRRQAAAVATRGVSLYELPDGMAMLSARLPAGEAVGAHAVLDHHARSAQGPNDVRTLDARRADALIDLVCGPVGHPSAGAGGSPRWREGVQVQVRVTVPFSTLFGVDEAPGELAGYGAITADQARELAAAGTWRRILTDPPTGLPIDFGTTTLRDTGPYCRRHHRLKQTPRWQVTHHRDGAVTWTTPSGHTYTSTPPPVAEPPPLPAPDPDEPPPF